MKTISPYHPGCTTNLPVDNAQFTLSVPRELATIWVTLSSIWVVQTAPNCSAVCHKGCVWGFESPTGKIRLKTIRQPARILFCSFDSMVRTSASLRLEWEKKLWWIRSMTYIATAQELSEQSKLASMWGQLWRNKGLPPLKKQGYHPLASRLCQSREAMVQEGQIDVYCRENRCICRKSHGKEFSQMNLHVGRTQD
jgi:hypothetical protein